jgi:GNAT superfamily N-acetyltransferase
MNIVKAQGANVKDIVKLNSQIHVDTPLFQGSSPLWVKEQVKEGHYFMIKDNDGVCGAVCLLEKDGQFHLETIAIEKDHQGRGLGKQFKEFAKTKAKENGFSSLFVDTYCEYNVDRFYEGCGFRKIPTFAKYRGKPYHRFTAEVE